MLRLRLLGSPDILRDSINSTTSGWSQRMLPPYTARLFDPWCAAVTSASSIWKNGTRPPETPPVEVREPAGRNGDQSAE